MTAFIKTTLKKSDDQTNIDIYRVAANITEYPIKSKLICLRIIIPKFMIIRQLFYVKNVCKNSIMFKMGVQTFLYTIIELLSFLHFIQMYQKSPYEF